MPHLLAIRGPQDRALAHRWVERIPDPAPGEGCWIVEVKEPKRSDGQNRLMWVWLGELSQKLPWHGAKLSADDYKDLLTASLRAHLRTVMNVEGTGFVVLGMRTSKFSKPQMSEFLELVQAFAAEHGVMLEAKREDYAA